VVESLQVKLLWEFDIHTLSLVYNNCLNIVVFLKRDDTSIALLEISCPADMNVLDKEEEK